MIALPEDDDIAFLQYTSCSTGDPKGGSLSHANLFANTGSGPLTDLAARSRRRRILVTSSA
ncbi:hypothetical protein C9993_07140 [Marinobacter sp. Z-F4-2]|nr:hypothetical protein C9993_07140 [Marinobacter sp. Z-F4-2]